MANGQPKPAFYVAVLLVVVGLVGLALWRYGSIGPGGGQAGRISDEELKQAKGGAEAPDSTGITTVKEYKYVAASRLPEVKGISSYKPMADRTVRFAINVWAGWSPIIYANNGFKPGKMWKTPDGKDFKLELVLIDDPIAMRDAYAAGNLHVGWATLDMLPLFLEGLRKDSRAMPRVFQQVDWSNGGDGIVVRDTVKTTADLRGKTIVLAQNSPSHFFVLNALINGGVQPAETKGGTAYGSASGFGFLPSRSARARLFAVASRTESGERFQRHSISRSTEVWSKTCEETWWRFANGEIKSAGTRKPRRWNAG